MDNVRDLLKRIDRNLEILKLRKPLNNLTGYIETITDNSNSSVTRLSQINDGIQSLEGTTAEGVDYLDSISKALQEAQTCQLPLGTINCEDKYDTPGFKINTAANAPILIARNTCHKVTVRSLKGSVVVQIGTTSFTLPLGQEITWEADTLLNEDIMVISGEVQGALVITMS